MILWCKGQPCFKGLVTLENLGKNRFFSVNYFSFGDAGLSSWQEKFPVNFLFFINHRRYSHRVNRNQIMMISSKTANVSKHFPITLSLY